MSANRNRWTLSNVLSASRLVLAFPLSYALYHADVRWVWILTIIAGLTDFFDGYIARRFNEVSDLGKILDPIADKVMVGMGAVAMYAAGALDTWFVIVVIARDFLILAAGLYAKTQKNLLMTSSMVGKVAVGIVALSLLLIGGGCAEYRHMLQWCAATALGISFIHYARSFARVLQY